MNYTKIPEFYAMRGICIDCGCRVIMAGVWANGAEHWKHDVDHYQPGVWELVRHQVVRVRDAE